MYLHSDLNRHKTRCEYNNTHYSLAFSDLAVLWAVDLAQSTASTVNVILRTCVYVSGRHHIWNNVWLTHRGMRKGGKKSVSHWVVIGAVYSWFIP